MVFILSGMLIVVLIFAAIIFITDKTVGWYYDNRDKKRRREHPELFRLFDEVNYKCSECCHWYNEQISPKKREIDNILKDWDYYTDERRTQKEAELKRLREDLQVAQTMDNVLESELVELREQTKDYVKKHNVEWAKQMGWT